MISLNSVVGTRGSLRDQLVRGGMGSVAVKTFGTLLTLFLTVLLARSLGPGGYGIYAYVLALVSLLAVPAQLGLPHLVMRETAKAHVNKQWRLMRGIWSWATRAVGIFSATLILSGIVAAFAFSSAFTRIELATFAWGLMLIPLIALGNLRGAALSGLQKVVQGQLPEHILRPGFFAALVLGCASLASMSHLTPAIAMALHAAASTLAIVVAYILLAHATPEPGKSAKPSYDSKAWIASAMPFALTMGMQLINRHTDILMLGAFRGADDVGMYRVAAQGAALVTFGLNAINLVVAPHFARLHEIGDHKGLQKLATASARATFALAVPTVFALALYGRPILGIVFGAEYAWGHTALTILAVGQLVSAAMGSVGFLLNMTGHERDTARGVAIAAVTNVVLNLALIPSLGITGAAIATSISIAVWNISLSRRVAMRLGLHSTIFGRNIPPHSF